MTPTTSDRRRLAITVDAARIDVAIPLDATVRDALTAMGVAFDPARHALVSRSGREVDVDSPVEQLTDGALLAVIDLTASSPRASTRWDPRASGRTDHHAVWWLLATASAAFAAGALADLARGATLLSDTTRVPVAAALGAGAALAATLWTSRAATQRTGAGFALTATSALAFAAGVAAVPHVEGATHLAVTVGLLSATVLMSLSAVANSSRAVRGAIGAASAVFLVLTIVWGATLLLEWSTATAAAISLGLVAPGIRWIPGVLLNLDDGYAINYEHFMSSRWTVRGAVPADPGPITMGVVTPQVDESNAKLATGVVMLSALGVIVTPLVTPGLDASGLFMRIGTIGVLATTIGALVLGPRRSPSPALRWVPRGAAALIIALTVYAAAAHSTDATRMVIALGLFAGALLAAILIVPVGRGVSSLVWSRLGDMTEALAVALALPLGLLAGDVLNLMRTVMAG